jgi:hypothetical protein
MGKFNTMIYRETRDISRFGRPCTLLRLTYLNVNKPDDNHYK